MPAAPVIQHRLIGGLAIDEHKDRILFRRIKFAWFDHPGVHHHAVADVELEELGRPHDERLDPGCRYGVVLQHTYAAVFRQFHQVRNRWLVESGPCVKRPTAVG